jgi:hypothetical protein
MRPGGHSAGARREAARSAARGRVAKNVAHGNGIRHTPPRRPATAGWDRGRGHRARVRPLGDADARELRRGDLRLRQPVVPPAVRRAVRRDRAGLGLPLHNPGPPELVLPGELGAPPRGRDGGHGPRPPLARHQPRLARAGAARRLVPRPPVGGRRPVGARCLRRPRRRTLRRPGRRCSQRRHGGRTDPRGRGPPRAAARLGRGCRAGRRDGPRNQADEPRAGRRPHRGRRLARAEGHPSARRSDLGRRRRAHRRALVPAQPGRDREPASAGEVAGADRPPRSRAGAGRAPVVLGLSLPHGLRRLGGLVRACASRGPRAALASRPRARRRRRGARRLARSVAGGADARRSSTS